MRRHNKKETQSVRLLIPSSQRRNAPRAEGWGNCDSAMSAPAKSTQDKMRLECTSCAPAGLHTSKSTQAHELGVVNKNNTEIEREKRMREILEEQAELDLMWIKNETFQKKMIESHIQDGLEKERRKRECYHIVSELRTVKDNYAKEQLEKNLYNIFDCNAKEKYSTVPNDEERNTLISSHLG